MDYRRIIPCLDVKHVRVVKAVNFIDLKDVGDPAAYSQPCGAYQSRRRDRQ